MTTTMEATIPNDFASQSAQYRLDAIPLAFSRHSIVFSKTAAAKLVGGRVRLRKLMETGKVRVEKKAMGKQNGKWYCNGSDVIRNIKL